MEDWLLGDILMEGFLDCIELGCSGTDGHSDGIEVAPEDGNDDG